MALELPMLQGLYAVQKLLEPLPEPDEITITTDPEYGIRIEPGQVHIIIYPKQEQRAQWEEAIKKERDKNKDIVWEMD